MFIERECVKILEFIKDVGKEIKNPISTIAKEVLLTKFGWPTGTGMGRAKEIILFLEKTGEIQCVRSPRGTLSSIELKTTKIPSMISIVNSKTETKEKEQEKEKPPHKKIMEFSIGDKNRNKGKKSEHNVFSALQRLNQFLLQRFSSVVFSANCKKSEAHDEDDIKGQDILWYLKSSTGEGFTIVQVKSSWKSVHKFNEEDAKVVFPGQEKAYFKKAFNGNIKRRQKSIILELLQEAINVNLLPKNVEDTVIKYF